MTAQPATPGAAAEAPPAGQRRGATTYFLALGGGQLCALARYSLLARILGPRELGLAATLILTAGLFNMMGDTGADRFLVQDKDGDSPTAQGLVQLMNLFRGLFISSCLLVFAGPIAAFFRQPEIAGGLRILALYPLLASFVHMDQVRLQRRHDFRLSGRAFFAAEAASMTASVAVALVTHSFVAAAAGLIVRSLAAISVSHLQAKRPFRWAFDKAMARRLARFSAPLMVNGLFLYLGSQSDRIVVIDALGPAALGHYSAVLLLIYYPSQILFRYLSVLNLPRVVQTRADTASRERAINELGGQVILLSSGMAIGFAIVAPFAIPIFFGGRFREGVLLVALIGILQSARFLRMWPTNLALGFGRSEIVMINSIVRLIGIPLAFAGARLIGGLEGITVGFVVGEVTAMSIARLNVNHAIGRPLFSDFDRIACFVSVALMVAAWGWVAAHPRPATMLAVAAASLAILAWLFRRERTTLAWAAAFAAARVRLLARSFRAALT